MLRRLTTILAADLAGYSRLMAADEEGVVARMKALRSDVIDPAVAAAGGRIVKTMGDGLLIEFSSPVEAVRAALAVQNKVNSIAAAVPQDKRMLFRIGVHSGDVMVDGDDLLGDVVNIAARLETLSPVGGLCISRTVRDHIGANIEAPLTELGPQLVKNMPKPVDVWRVEIKGAIITPAVLRAEQPSVAVLPFENRSVSEDDNFLADGIVEDVINELSKFRSLLVIARASTMSYRDKFCDARLIGRELGARYIVEGSIRRAGDRLRVSAQLAEAETGVQIWSERWDRTTGDIFDLQDDLTRAIVSAVEPELGSHERALARRKPTENLTAWELCQKGLGELLMYSDKEYTRAKETLTAACAADPDFALPQAHLARWYWNYVTLGRSSNPMGDVTQGLSHAKRALELDDRLDAAYYPLATLSSVAGRNADAQDAVDRGLALNPNNALLHHAQAVVSLWTETPDPDLMEASERRALRLNPKDPLAWGFHYIIAMAKFCRDLTFDCSDVTDDLDAACRYSNADYIAFMVNAIAQISNGREGEARRYLQEALLRKPDLTLEGWRMAFFIPMWPRMLAAQEGQLEALVNLGLPRA